MSRMNSEDARFFDPKIEMGLKFGTEILTLVGNITVDRDSPVMQFYDGGGAARNITMPAAERGLTFLITNISAAANNLVIKNPAATTIGTIAQATAAFVYSDGTNWYYGPLT